MAVRERWKEWEGRQKVGREGQTERESRKGQERMEEWVEVGGNGEKVGR